ncbi:conserved hypothetical protein [Trichophyton verrucosum HKI 0517]|uniref:Pal1 cell morphology protein n=1 Tax=Trichophyton verrucosum (strain HKI 0517) TaxID=663202 RepID=D4DBB6_TRIVH|nr:uncharacterized protein TRV_04415 [Trichophyton verrucosum HKI 0517]EFE40856.1 conserved hypothetical protein [Trichophyton verrucosum HKI 0517]
MCHKAIPPHRRFFAAPSVLGFVTEDEPGRGRQLRQSGGPSSVRRQRYASPESARLRSARLHRQPDSGPGHLTPSPHIQPDRIDRLDNVAGLYHHEGPYDPVTRERNALPDRAPVQALQSSNQEALNATSNDGGAGNLSQHYPLGGDAVPPPGSRDLTDRFLSFYPRTNVMVEAPAHLQRRAGSNYGDGDTLMDPYYNQDDIERRRLLRKRARSIEREEAEAAESASKKRDVNSRL